MKRFILSLACLVPCLFNSTAKADKNWDGDGSAGNFDWWNNWYGDTDPYAGWGFGTGNLNFGPATWRTLCAETLWHVL